MLGLGIDADRPRRRRGEGEDLGEGRDLERAVPRDVGGAQAGEAFARTKRLQLGKSEVLGEPAGGRDAVDHPRRPARGERRVIGDVGRARNLVLVAGDEDAVAGRHEVGLDEVRALLDRQRVGGERVFGTQARRAAMGDDNRPFAHLPRPTATSRQR